jgi:hypothetical protein
LDAVRDKFQSLVGQDPATANQELHHGAFSSGRATSQKPATDRGKRSDQRPGSLAGYTSVAAAFPPIWASRLLDTLQTIV